jgi:glucokinase
VYVCGVDIGGTKLLGRVFDPAGSDPWHAETRRPTPTTAAALIQTVGTLVDDLRHRLADHRPGAEISRVGVGIAGLVDRGGRLRFGPNLPGVVELAVWDDVATVVGLAPHEVVVENDATAATWAEHVVGAGAGIDELVLVTLGTGIGVGIVSGGRLVVGHQGFAGEAGHMIVDPQGPPCPCGQRGCWERFASGSGLGRLGREAAEAGHLTAVVAAVGDPESVRGDHVTAAAQAGDVEALAVFDEFARWVALGLANLTNVLDPEVLVIGGGLVAAGETLLAPVRRAYRGLLYAPDRRTPARVVAATLGESAGAIGAGLLAAR